MLVLRRDVMPCALLMQLAQLWTLPWREGGGGGSLGKFPGPGSQEGPVKKFC